MPRPGGVLPLHVVVGKTRDPVRFWPAFLLAGFCGLTTLFRTWILILGMSGIIVLFWFVDGGNALRYFVGTPLAAYFVYSMN